MRCQASYDSTSNAILVREEYEKGKTPYVANERTKENGTGLK